MPFENRPTALHPGSLRKGVDPAPAALGRYEIVDEIAHGGMGVVYRARDSVLGRVVALKVIRGGALAHKCDVERFLREAQAVAQLKHVNIIRIYDFGYSQGQPFFTMDLAENGSLLQRLPRLVADPRATAALVSNVARAVQYIHERGIVHRDLKPGNILLDQQDQPLVSDFGLAKAPEADGDLTGSGLAVGTPAYMAPEQAAGRNQHIGPTTDIWALGVILFELLTGARPFIGPEREDVTRAILDSEPRRPRSLQPRLARDLETIILKCLEKDPGCRYAAAADLADDLDRWQRGEPIQARPRSRLVRLGRWLKRRPALLAAGLCLLVLATILPPSLRYFDPERHGKALNARLQRGEKVELIGTENAPLAQRWRLPGSVGPPTKEECFTIQSGLVGLLELLPGPLPERYRFQAEVRHEFAYLTEEVGIYVGYSSSRPDKNEIHSLVLFSFADMGPKGPLWKINTKIRARLSLAMLSEPHLHENITHMALVALKSFAPPPPPDWRRLSVEVEPAEMRFFWEGLLVGRLKQAQREEFAQRLHKDAQVAGEMRHRFSPDGPLGLYVSKGGAAFRNVFVEPLHAAGGKGPS